MREKSQNSISGLAVLLVFGLFALCILLVLLAGAGSYERLAESDSADMRTAVQLLATRLRQCGEPSAVESRAFGDGDALVLHSQVGEDEYITLLYCYEGSLRELYTRVDRDFAPSYGEKLLAADALTVQQQDGLLCLELRCGENSALLRLSLRGEEAAG